MNYAEIGAFYKGKKVFITGHTGFKGSWLCKLLLYFGAEVSGYSLNPPTTPALYDLANVEQKIKSYIGDIRDYEKLVHCMQEVKPEIVIHMAAQPIVRTSYENPRETYEINVMGTVNLLEAVRQVETVRSVVNVTTDKVYKNREWCWGYRENEELNGQDPYSNSKSCSELVTSSYIASFFQQTDIAVSTARAGNVIGGGDFAKDRIIPDCIRAIEKKEEIAIRNPYSVRPYQHVLEPLIVYLMIAKIQYEDKKYCASYNVGPDDCNCWTTGRLVELFCNTWNESVSNQDENKAEGTLSWKNLSAGGPHEAQLLKLDCSLLKNTFGWSPKWHMEETIKSIVEWTKVYLAGENVEIEMEKQIKAFLE